MQRVLVLILLASSFQFMFAADPGIGVYELRVYYAEPGKLDDLNTRFRDHTMRLFEKHGMVNYGYWVPAENPDHKLIYVLGHKSREAAKKSWSGFGSDPEWRQAAKASEAKGKLVRKVESTYLQATDYSPDVKNTESSEPRSFELRTYKTTDGNLPALNARFRDHTMKLFSKHGMGHYGYWTPMDKQKGADDTLIYILTHKSREAAAASFKALRADPDWIAARKASEDKAGGSLTKTVESLFLKPTDYSPSK